MNNKSMVYSLGILAILTLGVITTPTIASADRAGYVTPYNSTRYARVQSNDQYDSYVVPNTIDYSATPIVYSGSPAPSRTTVVKTVAKKSGTVAGTSTKSTEDSSDLIASVIYGENSFMPSGLIQWIFLAILILLAIILVRRATGAKDKYHSEPMKHA